MRLFKRPLKDWKIRNLAYLVGLGTIILAIATFIVLTQLGFTKKTILRNQYLTNLNLIVQPLAPDNLADDNNKFDQHIKKVDKLIYVFHKGGELTYNDKAVKIKAVEDKDYLAAMSNLRTAWDNYKTSLYNWQTDDFKSSGNNKALSDLYAGFEKEISKIQEEVVNLTIKEERKKNIATVIIMLYVSFLIVMIILIMRYLILGPIYKVSLASRELAKGNLADKIDYNTRNEVGYIAKNTNALADILKNATNFTKKIGEGKLDAKFEGIDENDNALANSLLQMRDQMQESAKADQERNWVTEGLAKFADILRTNNDNIQDLSFLIISNLVKYIGANQGALFVLTDANNKDEETKIVLEAAYAYERRKRIKQELSIGEGLVGQVVQEGDKIYLTEVPENYVEIKSGLGETLPRAVLIVPLKINEEIRGVVEIASIDKIPAYKIEFVEKLGENIASTIANTKTNERTRKLLQESQEMTEQMRSQEEEMRQNMEEMEATQEEMARAQAEMEQKETSLNALINNTSDSIILIDTDYTILVMNQVIKDRYKGTQYEVMKEGHNALEMLGDVRDEWKAYYDRAFAGERLSFTIKSSVKGENSYRHYDINPIKDSHGNTTGASIFSRDITHEKKLEQEREEITQKMERRGFVMDAMINNTEDTFFAIDANYEILVVNDVLKQRFAQSNIDLRPGVNILDILPKDQLDKWKERYDKALDGEKLRIEEIRELPSGNLTIETRCEPITNDQGEGIGISTVSRDITELKRAEEQVTKLQQEIEKFKK